MDGLWWKTLLKFMIWGYLFFENTHISTVVALKTFYPPALSAGKFCSDLVGATIHKIDVSDQTGKGK